MHQSNSQGQCICLPTPSTSALPNLPTSTAGHPGCLSGTTLTGYTATRSVATPAARPTATDTNRHKQAGKQTNKHRQTGKYTKVRPNRQSQADTRTDRLTCLIAVPWTAELRSTIRVDEVLARDFSPPCRWSLPVHRGGVKLAPLCAVPLRLGLRLIRRLSVIHY